MPTININQTNASETAKGIVEEATQAEVNAGTDTGGTGARLFAVPSKIISYVSGTYQTIAGLASAVLGIVLTGFAAGANTAVSATDTLAQALAKFQGQINARLVASGIANRIPYWSTGTALTNDDHFTRDAATQFTHIGADVDVGYHADITITNDFLGLGIKGSQLSYRTPGATPQIYGVKAGDDTTVGGEKISTIFYTDLGATQDNFFQVTSTKLQALLTDDSGDYVGFSISDPEGMSLYGKDQLTTHNALRVFDNNTNGTLLFSVRNDGLVTATNALVVGGNATAAGYIRLKEDSDNGANYVQIQAPASLAADYTLTLPADDGSAANQFLKTDGSGTLTWATVKETVAISCSDLTTALTAGTTKGYITLPFAFTVTGVSASVLTAATGATLLTIDINESGTTILSTKLTFDASELTTSTAATPAVISNSSIAAYAPITVDIDAIGSTIAGAGLIVYLDGYRT